MGLGGAMVVSETVGSTSVAADRGVSISVGDDANAVLGVRADESQDGLLRDDISGTFTSPPIDLVFVNQADSSINSGDLTVSVANNDDADDITINGRGTDDDGNFDVNSGGETITPGGSKAFTTQDAVDADQEAILEATVETGGAAEIDVTVEEATFGGATISLTRTATLDNT